jgi:hypothetical protein
MYLYEMVKKVLNYIQNNWFAIAMIIIVVYMVSSMQITKNKYEKDIVIYKDKISALEKENEISLKIIDSLRKMDTVYIEKIKTIKGESYETIKLIDTMSISSMQKFFSDRYSKEK